MKISGLSALVTGAASGMGESTARLLAEQGAKVVCLDMNEVQVERVANEIDGLGIGCDVANAASVESAVTAASEAFGAARILVNCAGIATAQRIVGRDGPMPLEDFSRVIEVNLIGTFNVMRMAAAGMMDLDPVNETGERGVIINTTSVAAYDGQIGQAAYSASKGGLVSLTLPAAREFGSKGIRVMTIAPGLIATPLMLGLPQDAQDSLARQPAFPKRLGQPSEFARLVQHIIENEMLNAEVIRLDGGIRMQAK